MDVETLPEPAPTSPEMDAPWWQLAADDLSTFAAKKKKAGEHVELITLQNIGHFEIVDPGSSAWKQVEDTFLSLTRR